MIIRANGGLPATQEDFAGQVAFAIPAMLGGPSVAGILMTAMVSGKAGFRDLFAWHAPIIRGWPSVALADGLPAPLFAAVSSALVLVGQLPAYRVLIVWVYDHTGSLLVAMLMHTSLTACTFILGPAVIGGTALLVYDVVLGAAWWAIVAVVAVTNRWHFSRPGKPRIDAGAPQFRPR